MSLVINDSDGLITMSWSPTLARRHGRLLVVLPASESVSLRTLSRGTA